MYKKIFSLIFLLSNYSFIQAQISITRADMPCPAANCGLDSVLFTTVPPVQNTIDINTTGASSIWNILPLQNGTTSYQKFYPVNMTPIDFQLAFLGSDYAQPLLGNQNLVGLPVSDAYEFYNYAANSSRLEIKGFAAHMALQGIPFPLLGVYSSPDVLYRFPLNFGDTDSSTSSYSVSVPPTTPFATIKRQQKRVNLVDGWGSLTTPAGNFDVLRVKSDINRVDSIVTQLVPMGTPSHIIEYKWLGAGLKIPALQVTGNEIANNYTQSLITFWGEDPLSVFSSQTLKVNNLLIYPNPTSNNAQIQFQTKKNGQLNVEIYDIYGKRVAHFHFLNSNSGNYNETLPTGKLSAGSYFIKCSVEDDITYSTFLKME